MTAKSRDAMAAPEMRERATILKSEAVLVTVAGERSEGSGKAVGMAAVEGLEFRLLLQESQFSSSCDYSLCRRVRTGILNIDHDLSSVLSIFSP